MHFINAAPILLLAGAALAAPLNDLERKQFQGAHVKVVTEVDIATVVQTVEMPAGGRPTGAWGGHGHGPQGPQSSSVAGGFSMPAGGFGGPNASPTPTPGSTTGGDDGSDETTPTPTPSTGGRGGKGSQPTPSPAGGKPGKSSTPSSPSSSQPTGSTGGNTGSTSSDADTSTINKYRAMMNKGLKNLTYDTKLAGNIADTLKSAPGQMVHKLNPGTMGQVLAGGDCSDFTTALVQGWICEIPSLLPSVNCNSGGYVKDGQTGHAKILSDSGYSKVACACQDKIWGCDFA